jgi:hypothetical protein
VQKLREIGIGVAAWMVIAWQDPRRLYSFYEVETPGVKKIIENLSGIPEPG